MIPRKMKDTAYARRLRKSFWNSLDNLNKVEDYVEENNSMSTVNQKYLTTYPLHLEVSGAN